MTGAESLLSHYLAPLQPFLCAEGVTEVVVNQPGEAGVERWGRWDWHALPQLSAGWCLTLAQAAAAAAVAKRVATKKSEPGKMPAPQKASPASPPPKVRMGIRRRGQRVAVGGGAGESDEGMAFMDDMDLRRSG